MQPEDQKKDWRQGLKELIWMAVPGIAGTFLFLWGLKICAWSGHVCVKGGILAGIGAVLSVLSLYIYWRTDFRGKPDGMSFPALLISTGGTAILAVILTRLLTRG